MHDAETPSWRWDPTLYGGSAAYYARGRVPYPRELIDLLVDELRLDGIGRLLDIGCGPGSLSLPLAAHVEQVVGVDADGAMLTEAQRAADLAGIPNTTWLNRRAEDLSPDIGPFRAVTMAQSFHWMERPRVVALLPQLLVQDGVVAYVHATTHQGVEGSRPLRHPRPPRREIDTLIAAYTGDRRRAGLGFRDVDRTSEQERADSDAAIFRAAGLSGPQRRAVPGRVVDRSADEVVASVFSLSYAAPHLFGDRVAEFERDLRDMLARTSSAGRFSEEMREIAVELWRR